MKRFLKYAVVIIGFGILLGSCSSTGKPQDEWISLFDGKTLQGWNAGENNQTFSVEDGKIVVHGPRDHLFYTGPVQNHDFKNFSFKADVMTTPGSNSGIYFHTSFQDKGWPSKGFEVQVNNSFDADPRRTASLYGIDDVHQAPAADNEWFTMEITVKGKKVTVKVDGETLVNYTEPDGTTGERKISSGTFALQGHDPASKVFYKNIFVKPLK